MEDFNKIIAAEILKMFQPKEGEKESIEKITEGSLFNCYEYIKNLGIEERAIGAYGFIAATALSNLHSAIVGSVRIIGIKEKSDPVRVADAAVEIVCDFVKEEYLAEMKRAKVEGMH